MEEMEEFIQEDKRVTSYHNSDGQTSDKETPKSCAKTVKNINKSTTTHYVKFFRGRIFDPHGIDGRKGGSAFTKYKKVQKQTFKYYSQYLKTKNQISFTRAERSFIDV